MGGIISCELGKRLEVNVASIITLGTPFAGTKIHMLGLKNHVHDLAEGSEYCDIERQIKHPHLCFWSPYDSIVLPSSNSYLEHLSNKKVLVGHLSFLLSTVVFREIHSFYERES